MLWYYSLVFLTDYLVQLVLLFTCGHMWTPVDTCELLRNHFSVDEACNKYITVRLEYRWRFVHLEVGLVTFGEEHFQYRWNLYPALITRITMDTRFYKLQCGCPNIGNKIVKLTSNSAFLMWNHQQHYIYNHHTGNMRLINGCNNRNM